MICMASYFNSGPIWVYARDDMGSRERSEMGLESRAVSARVIKQIVTIFSNSMTTRYIIFLRELVTSRRRP